MNKLFTKPEIDIYKFTIGDIVYTSAEGVPDEALIGKDDDNNQTGFGS